MQVFQTSWLTQAQILTDAVDDIVTVEDFLFVSESHILEDVNRSQRQCHILKKQITFRYILLPLNLYEMNRFVSSWKKKEKSSYLYSSFLSILYMGVKDIGLGMSGLYNKTHILMYFSCIELVI